MFEIRPKIGEYHMFYMYNSLVAFKIPPFPQQAEAPFLRYSASASRKNSPPPSLKRQSQWRIQGRGLCVGGGERPPPPLILRPNWGLKGRNQFRIRGPTRFGKALNLIFPKLSSQNMRSFDHATILSYSFHGLRKKHLAQWPAFCFLLCPKNSGGVTEGVCGTLPETLTLFQSKICDFLYPGQTWSKIWYPISDLMPWSPARDKLLRHVRGSWRKH